MENQAADAIVRGKTVLGIELGSTRIKAVLIDESFHALAWGSHSWENRMENGVWTYSLDDVWTGLQACYCALTREVVQRWGVALTTVGAIGVSAMMHGYLAFDAADHLLVPFRTWRNTCTAEASAELTELFAFHVPQRWTVAHYDQAMLNREPHVSQVRFLTTLSGYIHWKLTGRQVLGIGDASGMFPVDPVTHGYRADLLKEFDALIIARGYSGEFGALLPEILVAGQNAGRLTGAGARLLDPTGRLQPGIPFCPPEGDAGTGMVFTNSVLPRTCNVSAGTSIFSMVVLEKLFSRVYPQIDMVTTPDGAPVAMVHCNNCTSDINAWVGLLGEFGAHMGVREDPDARYADLFRIALQGDVDCGGLLTYNYESGEHLVDLDAGCPLFLRAPDSHFTLANFMRAQLYSALATLRLGMDVFSNEHVRIDRISGHGGFFKTPGVGQTFLASAIGSPVFVMAAAGEGGAWGMALLAAYLLRGADQSLGEFLEQRVFAGIRTDVAQPNPACAAGFEEYLRRFSRCLPVERAAVESLRA